MPVRGASTRDARAGRGTHSDWCKWRSSAPASSHRRRAQWACIADCCAHRRVGAGAVVHGIGISNRRRDARLIGDAALDLGRTLTSIVALAPLARLPSAQATVPRIRSSFPGRGRPVVAHARQQVVGDGDAAGVGGSQVLCRERVREVMTPLHRVRGVRLASDRSADAITAVSALASLFAGSGSATAEETPAWLVMLPSLCGRTLTSIVALAPLGEAAERAVDGPQSRSSFPGRGRPSRSSRPPEGRR